MTSLIFAASLGDQITQAVADVAEALRYPVLIAAMLALLLVAWEIGRLAVEAWKRSQRPKTPFELTARQALAQRMAGDTAGAQATLTGYAYGEALKTAAIGTLMSPDPLDAQRAVIVYDLYVSKRLDRVRLLVRAGPALGLMGTLIPLAPALAALGKGQPDVLADELQTAFAITVVGVLVGLLAFTVALARERYFTRDLADLEFLRELRGDAVLPAVASAPQPAAAGQAHKAAVDSPPAAASIDANATIPGSAPAVSPGAAPTAPAAQQSAPAPQTPQAIPPAPTSPGAPTVPGAVPAAPPAFPPLVAEEPKKRFGLKKKSKPEAPAVPAAFPPPPPAQPAPGAATTDAAAPKPSEGSAPSAKPGSDSPQGKKDD